MSAEARIPVMCLAKRLALEDVIMIVHERTPFTVAAVQSGQVDAIIAQNPGHVVRSAVRILKARSMNLAPVMAQEKIRIEILLRDNL